MTTLPAEVLADPSKHGYATCDNCNGYGSSPKEDQLVCSKCDGSGLVQDDKRVFAKEGDHCGVFFDDTKYGSTSLICTLKRGHPKGHGAPEVGRFEREAPDAQPEAPKAKPAITHVWVAVVSFDSNIRIWASEDRSKVESKVAEWCREWWSKEDVSVMIDNPDYDPDDEDSEEEIEEDPANMDDGAVIDAYFEQVEADHCEIKHTELI